MNLYNPFKKEAYVTSFKEDFQRKKYTKMSLLAHDESVESINVNAKSIIIEIRDEKLRKKASRFSKTFEFKKCTIQLGL